MELKTVAECDVALHYLDTILGDHRREYNDATEKSREYTQKANLAWNQLNITHEQISEIELRKKDLCDTNLTESHLSNVNSSQSSDVRSAIDLLDETQTLTGADLKSMVND